MKAESERMTRELPILMRAPMVRGTLDGSKWKTRRVVKPQPYDATPVREGAIQLLWDGDVNSDKFARGTVNRLCPYGAPGDRLWVKETWAVGKQYNRLSPSKFCNLQVDYKADEGCGYWEEERGKWRPSIYMPRWASRILLEVIEVRVERLQDITEEDAEAEGVDFIRHYPDADERLTAVQLFQALWESINGDESWAANPWVWVITFKRIKP